MFTHPDHTRKGVGRLLLSLSEDAARRDGFKRVELMATLAGELLYRASGYESRERIADNRGGVEVPFVRMCKQLREYRAAGRTCPELWDSSQSTFRVFQSPP